MTTTPTNDSGNPGPTPDPDTPSGPRVSADEVRDLGRLRRSATDRKISGVAGGLARHLDVDPTVIRVAFVVLALFGGAGIILYGALWLLVPEDGEPQAKLHLDPKTRTIAILVAGVIAIAALLGDSWNGFGFPWPAVIIGGIALLVLANRQKRVSTGLDQPGGVSTGLDRPVGPAPRLLSKRELYGPSLFLPTLAAIAVALGLLRLWELDGHHLATGAYPALALAICGAALVIGAWMGRAGAVLWLAMFSGIALGASNVAENVGTTVERPQLATGVHSTYDLGIGKLVLDLSEVTDPAGLNGRTVSIDGNLGQIEVIVPDNVDVTAVADISGGGDVTLFGEHGNGDQPHLEVNHVSPGSRGSDTPHLTIHADLNFGNITIKDETP